MTPTFGVTIVTQANSASTPRPSDNEWIIVADSPFLPAHGGGELEHLGFVTAAVERGLVAALVVPTDTDPSRYGRSDDLEALRELVAPRPTFFVPRNRSLRAGVLPWRPYVVGSRPIPPWLVPALRHAAPQATGVVVFSYKSHHLGRRIARGLGLPAILRTHNLEGRYHRALARSERGPRSWGMWVEAARIAVDERVLERRRSLVGIADISEADAKERGRRSTTPVRYVPTFSFNRGLTQQPSNAPRDRLTVVFVGALDVATNQDALTWFATRVWPMVRADEPRARLLVVGRRPDSSLLNLVGQTPGAELHADVPDPGVYLRSATVAVNPAVSGSGVNIKLVEYLSTGIPVVSTTLGSAGIGLCAGEDLDVVDDAAGFAAAVLSLLHDEPRATAMGRQGRRAAAKSLAVDQSIEQLKAMFAAHEPTPTIIPGSKGARAMTAPSYAVRRPRSTSAGRGQSPSHRVAPKVLAHVFLWRRP
ncbi:MAG: glycosyltransferase [Candidatus Phosphoribacter sp.]